MIQTFIIYIITAKSNTAAHLRQFTKIYMQTVFFERILRKLNINLAIDLTQR